MSFINWGEESAEQKALRAFFEQQALYEQAVRIKMQSQGGVGAAGAGGTYEPLEGLFGVGADGLIYTLDRNEANWPFNYLPFPTQTAITLNTDDNGLYAVVDSGEAYFIKIDKETRELTFFDNNISDYTTKGSSSLYYEGNGSFIYLDNGFKKTGVSSIIRVTLNEFSSETVDVTEVSEVDDGVTGYLLRNLFLYDGTPWAIAYAGPDIIIGPFDIDAGDFIYSNILAPSPSETRVELILGVFSTVEHRGTVYSAIVFADSELDGDPNLGLFKVDTETGGALAPYYISLVKDLFLDDHENVPVLSLFSY
ncbi:hypothetical protein UFOVP699_207 [uncultured Caudovirales phage]|uniref:Uncharacterized protein n=1 Tax=uncultured Caudovirales phage TaxID=2100421 RepID=A0A6J5NQ26_9CAUD|nr:hypothetical protein UFOVP699_207 [uncultured Caudovirales phage]